jgi:hypothetical protein
MRKIGILVSAAVFDLGVITVSGQAAQVDMFLKIKIDAVNTPAVCAQKGGTVVEDKGQKYCQTTKPDGTAPRQ